VRGILIDPDPAGPSVTAIEVPGGSGWTNAVGAALRPDAINVGGYYSHAGALCLVLVGGTLTGQAGAPGFSLAADGSGNGSVKSRAKPRNRHKMT
jgi:hypothetical protein